jgi:group I intron endonuclease
MRVSGIYKIQSKCKPERIYVGSAVNIRSRWSQHKWYLRRNKHHTSKLQRHYNKYGESDLMFTVLITCEVDELLNHEQFFLDSLSPWFNTCKIAGSTIGFKASDETKAKLSKLKKGIPVRPAGSKLTEEHKRKISEAQMGEKNSMYGTISPIRGKKMPPNKWKGKHGRYSEETLAKMRISNKRAWEIRKQNKNAA